jgi:DNA-binding CsgD family transcriptional regulator
MARHHVKSNDLFLALLLLVTGAATIIDLTSDGFNKESLTHLLIEGFIFLASSAAFVVLFVRIRKDLAIISSTRSELTRSHADAAAWKKRANVFIMGLGEEIQAQFDQWDLTPAEKEVALLLIKGLSHQEIADLTHRSERTIRQHAGSVYQKSDLTGRAELSAFFLEDLLSVFPTGNAYETPDPSRTPAASM